MNNLDIVLRYVDEYGWIGILIVDEKELFRSEFYEFKGRALAEVEIWMRNNEAE